MNNTDHSLVLNADERGTYFLLKPVGAFSAQHVLEIRKKIEQALAMGHTRLAIDLSEVNFMDSTGLGLLINVMKNLAKQKGGLVLFNPSTVAFNLFQATNTHSVFEIRNQVENPDSLFD